MAMSPYLTTPFHDRIAPLCETDSWQRWEGYTTVATVTALDEEYFAIRNAATRFRHPQRGDAVRYLAAAQLSGRRRTCRAIRRPADHP